MDFESVVRRRRMVRRFDPDRPVPRRQVDRLLDLARRGPSAGHTQGWHFLVLDDRAGRDGFWAATADPGRPPDVWLAGLRTAPTLILVLTSEQAYLDRYAEPDKRRAPAGFAAPWWWIDAGMAAHTLLLGAIDQGLGACLFGVPGERVAAVRDRFGVPDRFTPLGVVALGVPVPTDRRSPSLRRGRREWDEVVSYGRFGSAAPSD